MDMFWNLYGAEAGNMALKVLPRGGLYLAGGIVAKNFEALRSGPFMAAFGAKGRMSDLVREMPVRAILDQNVGLLGAAQVARGM
jgi:glucokinase